MDVALARTGRTRDLWARTYLELDLLPQHRQTVDIRSKLFDHVCSHRKSVPAGLGDDVFFLERVPPSVAIDDPYQSEPRNERWECSQTVVTSLERSGCTSALPP